MLLQRSATTEIFLFPPARLLPPPPKPAPLIPPFTHSSAFLSSLSPLPSQFSYSSSRPLFIAGIDLSSTGDRRTARTRTRSNQAKSLSSTAADSLASLCVYALRDQTKQSRIENNFSLFAPWKETKKETEAISARSRDDDRSRVRKQNNLILLLFTRDLLPPFFPRHSHKVRRTVSP